MQNKKLTVIRFCRKKTISNFNKILNEWVSWEKEVLEIKDQPYDKNTQSNVFADGKDMMLKHSCLQERTVTFLDNNIEGHWFLEGRKGNRIDAKNLRLKYRVEHRIQELQEIGNSLEYANGATGYYVRKLNPLPYFKVIVEHLPKIFK